MSLVNLTIDGKNLKVSKDTSVIEAAKEVGIEIPALCYDPDLEIVGACRMCIVEIEGSRKLQTACSTKVWEGMVVHTESERVVKHRKEIMQLLLDSHPNDCLTCQKAGDCYLQEYAYRYDVKFQEHDGAMRPQLLDTSSPYILKDNAKCILCGKCVRTCYVLEERQVLAFAGRGYDTKIVCDSDQTMEESTCVSCNRCVSVCPVGALVDKREYGKLRNWEGESNTVNCQSCHYGCEFEVRSKDDENVAVIANPPTNGRPLCLKGRLTTELLYVDKPEKPYRKIGGEFEETTWNKALGLEKIMDKLEQIDEE